MHDMVSREEFNSFALDVKHAAEKEKNILSSKIDTLQIENVSLKQRLDDLESKLDSTEKCAKLADYKANVNSEKCEDLEQHGRANSIRIYGTVDTNSLENPKETAEVVLRTLKDYLEIDLSMRDIDVAHRLGVFTSEGSRGIICKFVKRTDKIHVIQKPKNVAQTGIVIKEDISPANRKLMTKVSEKDEVTQVWSHNGRILGKMQDGNIRQFHRDVKNAIDNYEKQNDISVDAPQDNTYRSDSQHRSASNRVKKPAATDYRSRGGYDYGIRGGYDYRSRGYGGYNKSQPAWGRGRGSGYRQSFNNKPWFDRQ